MKFDSHRQNKMMNKITHLFLALVSTGFPTITFFRWFLKVLSFCLAYGKSKKRHRRRKKIKNVISLVVIFLYFQTVIKLNVCHLVAFCFSSCFVFQLYFFI